MRAEAIDGVLERAVAGRAAPGVVAMVGDRDGVIYEGAARGAAGSLSWRFGNACFRHRCVGSHRIGRRP